MRKYEDIIWKTDTQNKREGRVYNKFSTAPKIPEKPEGFGIFDWLEGERCHNNNNMTWIN